MKLLITTLSTLALAAPLSFAQDKPAEQPEKGGAPGEHKRPSPEEIFKKMDSNSDGCLSLEEFKASRVGKKDPAKAEEIFKKSDANSDGKLTTEEFKAAHQHREGRKGGQHKGGEAPAPK